MEWEDVQKVELHVVDLGDHIVWVVHPSEQFILSLHNRFCIQLRWKYGDYGFEVQTAVMYSKSQHVFIAL